MMQGQVGKLWCKKYFPPNFNFDIKINVRGEKTPTWSRYCDYETDNYRDHLKICWWEISIWNVRRQREDEFVWVGSEIVSCCVGNLFWPGPGPQQAGDWLDRDDSEGSKARHTAHCWLQSLNLELQTLQLSSRHCAGLLQHTFSYEHRLHLGTWYLVYWWLVPRQTTQLEKYQRKLSLWSLIFRFTVISLYDVAPLQML